MKLFQTLGTDFITFSPEDLWDDDDECLTEEGRAVLSFAMANQPGCSIDFGEYADKHHENAVCKAIFEERMLTHKVPAETDWWHHVAQICYRACHDDSEDAAKIFYAIHSGEDVSNVLDYASGVDENFEFDTDSDGVEDAYVNASRSYFSSRMGESEFDDIESYMDFRSHGKENYTVLDFCGSYIVTEDNY